MKECHKSLSQMASLNKKKDKIAEAEGIIKELEDKKVQIID